MLRTGLFLPTFWPQSDQLCSIIKTEKVGWPRDNCCFYISKAANFELFGWDGWYRTGSNPSFSARNRRSTTCVVLLLFVVIIERDSDPWGDRAGKKLPGEASAAGRPQPDEVRQGHRQLAQRRCRSNPSFSAKTRRLSVYGFFVACFVVKSH